MNAIRLRTLARLPGARGAAFTLVEMLVAMAIITLIILALLTMTNSVNLTWLVNSKRAEVLQTGRAVMNQIARDLSAALLRPDFKTQYLQFVENPNLAGTFTTPAIVSGTDTMFWQSALAKFTSTSPKTDDHLTVVGYYLANNAARWPSLYRFYSERPVGAVTGPGYNLYQTNPSNNPVGFLSGANLTGPGVWDGTGNGWQGASILATNVLGLWIRCRDVHGYPIPYDQVRQVPRYAGTTTFKYDSSWLGTNSRIPASVEISIVCIDSRSLSRLQSQGLSLPAITPVTDPCDGVSDPNDTVNNTTGADNYHASITAFINSPIFKEQNTAIQSFTAIVPLFNGTYAKRY